MKVNFVDLVAQYQTIRDEIHVEFEQIMSTASFVMGKPVADFEAAFAAYCGTRHCVGVASGADALHLAIRALGIGPGDEVITVANTFIATPNAIALAGATPVLVDMRDSDYNMDPALLEAAISTRTKAILPVHLYGQPADMDPIIEVAKRHSLCVIEDAAQAHGATYKGKAAGSLGRCGCFSFYPGKNLGAYGQGGAITTDDAELDKQLRILRECGQSAKYVHPVVGFNSRLDTLQAAVLSVKLKRLPAWNERRRYFASRYAELLSGTRLVLPQTRDDAGPVWHLYVAQHGRRDALMEFLKEREIYCGLHYPIPVHEQAAYAGVRCVPEGAPAASRASKRIVSLPMHPDLSDEQVEYVAKTVREFEAA